jgi:hypothetical protein
MAQLTRPQRMMASLMEGATITFPHTLSNLRRLTHVDSQGLCKFIPPAFFTLSPSFRTTSQPPSPPMDAVAAHQSLPGAAAAHPPSTTAEDTGLVSLPAARLTSAQLTVASRMEEATITFPLTPSNRERLRQPDNRDAARGLCRHIPATAFTRSPSCRVSSPSAPSDAAAPQPLSTAATAQPPTPTAPPPSTPSDAAPHTPVLETRTLVPSNLQSPAGKCNHPVLFQAPSIPSLVRQPSTEADPTTVCIAPAYILMTSPDHRFTSKQVARRFPGVVTVIKTFPLDLIPVVFLTLSF